MDEAHFRGLERVYRAAPCNAAFPASIEVGRGESTLRLSVDPGHFHGGGALHGHVLFKLLDDAAFFAASSRVAERLVLTVEYQIRFLRPVRGGALEARGRLVQRTRNLVVAESVVTDAGGRGVARGSGSFLPSGPPLAEVPGYAAPG